MFIQIGSISVNLDQVAYVQKTLYANQRKSGTIYYFNFISSEGTHELDFREEEIPEALKEYLSGKITRLQLQETLWGE